MKTTYPAKSGGSEERSASFSRNDSALGPSDKRTQFPTSSCIRMGGSCSISRQVRLEAEIVTLLVRDTRDEVRTNGLVYATLRWREIAPNGIVSDASEDLFTRVSDLP